MNRFCRTLRYMQVLDVSPLAICPSYTFEIARESRKHEKRGLWCVLLEGSLGRQAFLWRAT